jgi:predicted alternative tryptophan synthase beta-subunit
MSYIKDWFNKVLTRTVGLGQWGTVPKIVIAKFLIGHELYQRLIHLSYFQDYRTGTANFIFGHKLHPGPDAA